MRKISKTLAVVGLLTPLSVGALGIGEIRLKSALNQNLSAEVPLLLSVDESVPDIRVNLASPEAFRRAGIDLAHFLHGLSFEVVPKPDGRFSIKMSSRDAIREPFLNFLIEVSWPKGRMQREFTLLLDPPTTFQKGVAIRTAPRTAAKLSAQPAQPAAGDYGPVASGETLWSITRKLNASGAPSQRMMQEIFENNPDAFHRGDMNALKQGVTLRVPGVAAAKPEKELTLATPGREAEGKGKPGSATKSEIALEVADTVRQENEDIRNRLAELEKQLSTMQRLVTLKDQQLAALQSGQLVTQPAASPAPAVAPPSVLAAPSSVVEPKPAEIPPLAPPSAAVQPPAREAGKMSGETVPAAPAQPVPKPVIPTPALAEEPGFFAENSSALAGGAFALLLGGLVVAIIRRRRAALLEIEEEEHTQPMQLTGADDRPDKGRVAGLITPSQQGSFLSEFTPSDFDVLDTDNEAIDPLSEADVYLAYGRYQQAEELIKQAINENPFRDECKLKLLEVYYSAQNRQAFEQYAGELASNGKNADREFWSRVAAMGAGLCPDSALFGGVRPVPEKSAPVPSPEAVAVVPPPAGTDELEIDLDIPRKMNSTSLTGGARVHGGVSFDADSQDISVTEDIVLPAAAEEEIKGNEIEFDLSAFSREEPAVTPAEAGKSGDAMDRASLDFDLSSFEISSLSEPAGDARPEIPSAAPSGGLSHTGELDFKIDFAASATEAADVGDLTDMDEVETKLDLARAYVDMDDKQSARRLLEEIIAEGGARQQEEAKALLGRLA